MWQHVVLVDEQMFQHGWCNLLLLLVFFVDKLLQLLQADVFSLVVVEVQQNVHSLGNGHVGLECEPW